MAVCVTPKTGKKRRELRSFDVIHQASSKGELIARFWRNPERAFVLFRRWPKETGASKVLSVAPLRTATFTSLFLLANGEKFLRHKSAILG